MDCLGRTFRPARVLFENYLAAQFTRPRSKRLADSHAPCPSVLAAGEVGAKVNVIFPAELESDAAPATGEKIAGSEQL